MTTNNDIATTTNQIAINGEHRCYCGCKYWHNDRCIDCNARVIDALDAEVIVYLAGEVTTCFVVKMAALTPITLRDCITRKVRMSMSDYLSIHNAILASGEYITFI